MIRKYFTSLAVLLIGVGSVHAQQDTVYKVDSYLGSWTGIITQVSGPTIRYFDMEMSVAPQLHTDSIYDIRSHVMDGEYHAYMVGEAYRTAEGNLFIAEREIIRSDSIPGMEWCIKELELKVVMEDDNLHLKGKWTGGTSFGDCEPGEMDLVQAVIRP